MISSVKRNLELKLFIGMLDTMAIALNGNRVLSPTKIPPYDVYDMLHSVVDDRYSPGSRPSTRIELLCLLHGHLSLLKSAKLI